MTENAVSSDYYYFFCHICPCAETRRALHHGGAEPRRRRSDMKAESAKADNGERRADGEQGGKIEGYVRRRERSVLRSQPGVCVRV